MTPDLSLGYQVTCKHSYVIGPNSLNLALERETWKKILLNIFYYFYFLRLLNCIYCHILGWSFSWNGFNMLKLKTCY